MHNNKNGIFITFEGIDGSGKSTQAERLKSWLEGLNCEVLRTFEPGGWNGGENIRKMLLNGEIKDDIARLLLFLADRKFHVEKVIKPALEAGNAVICDRYTDSTIAYQGVNLDYDFVKESVELFDFIRPDVTFLLASDDVNSALLRVDSRNAGQKAERDFIESSGVNFIKKIAENYDKIRLEEEALNIKRIVRLNADNEADNIEMAIRAEILGIINKTEEISG